MKLGRCIDGILYLGLWSGLTLSSLSYAAQTIAVASGNDQTADAGSPLPDRLVVAVRDSNGKSVSGLQIEWTITGGGGSFRDHYSATSADGHASNYLTLGKTRGGNTVTARIVKTTASVALSATGIVGPPVNFAIVSGNNQAGTADSALANALTVSLADQYGNPVSGVEVKWSVTGEGATLASAKTLTSKTGGASNTLTLGSAAGVEHVAAAVEGTELSQTFIELDVDAAITLQVTPASSSNARAFQPYFQGLSYPKNRINIPLFNADNKDLVALFKGLGPGILRIVAEQDPYPIVWDHGGAGLTSGEVSKVDLIRLAAFVKATNWKILYGIAFAGNNASCAEGATDCAADEARIVAEEFGDNLYGFEIGNEPDQYPNPVFGDPPVAQVPNYTYADYISTTPVYSSSGVLLPSWPAFAAAIRAVVPNAPLTGPTTGITWDLDFASSDQASQVVALTRHYYRSSVSNPPDMTTFLAPDPRVPTQFAELAQAAAAAKIPDGYRVSECNSVSGPVPGVTNGFGAVLWTIDFLFQNALYGSSGVNFHEEGDVAASFTPILDNGTSVTGLGPDYYGMYAYELVSQGGSLVGTQVSPSPTTFSAYAVQQPNGYMDFILSNKDPVNSMTISVTRGATPTAANALLLTAPSLTATTGFELGGSPIGTDGTWAAASFPAVPIYGGTVLVTVPPGSAQIVQMQ